MPRVHPGAYIFSPSPLTRELLAEVLRARLGIQCTGAAPPLTGWQHAANGRVLLVDQQASHGARTEDALAAARAAGLCVVPFASATPLEEIIGAVRSAMCIAPAVLETLTPQETRVLIGLAAGHRNAEVARRQRRSVKTVEKHRANLQRKLGMRSVAQMTAFALRTGLLDMETILAQRR